MLFYLASRGITPGPLFRFEDGRPLTSLVDQLCLALSEASNAVDESRYSGHSFRIGAGTTAAARRLKTR